MKRLARSIALLLLSIAIGVHGCRKTETPNVILIVIDTLRADHLGIYGYTRATSPHLDELFRSGTRFENARATSSWTLPSVASILTGLSPAVHGLERSNSMLSDRTGMMQEAFQKRGYETVALSANPAFVTPIQGFSRGFDRFTVLHGPPTGNTSVDASPGNSSLLDWVSRANADDVTSAALDWLSSRTSAKPFFLYLHYFDQHGAYNPPRELAERFGVAAGDPLAGPAQWPVLQAPEAPDEKTLDVLVSLYDATIAATDASIGRLLGGLDPALRASTILVVTADHGEEFGDHGGMQHGRTLYDELLRVPLVIAGPRIESGAVVSRPVSLIQLWATFAELTGIPAPPASDDSGANASLLDAAGTQPVYADLDARFQGDLQQHRRALVEGDWKLIVDPHRGTTMFELGSDRRETRDVAPTQSERRSRMATSIADRDARAVLRREDAPPGRTSVDPVMRSRLQSLGYLQ